MRLIKNSIFLPSPSGGEGEVIFNLRKANYPPLNLAAKSNVENDFYD
jgi:hypothetical protein